jgi:hypothetical protein
VPVLVGPFGDDKVSCGPKQRCIITVTELSLTPTEQANHAIAFAAG